MVPASRPFLSALALGSALGLGLTNHGRAQTELPKSSPFMSTSGPAAASGLTETIEFAAVRTIGARTEIDLYDTQGKKNHWIPLGGTVDGLTVMTYDARHDQVMATIGGVNKRLTLRQTKGVAAGTAAVTTGPTANFGVATPPTSAAVIAFPTAAAATASTSEAAATTTPAATAAPTTPAPAPAQPAAPLTVARQEEEARMLVSDLLEIGMAQRKAYEEKQKQAANPNAAPTATAEAPAATPPNPGGPPSGG